MMKNPLPSRNYSQIGWLFIAVTLTWILSVLLLSFTLGNYEQQINQFAVEHQGQRPTPTQRANLYATSLTYLRVPGVAAEAISFIPLLFVVVGVYLLFISRQEARLNIIGIFGITSAVGSLAFWLFWTYLGMGLILGNPAHLPPFVGDPLLNSRPTGSPILFTAGVLAIITVILVSIRVFTSKILARTATIIGVLGVVMLLAVILLRVGIPPLVPHLLLLPFGIGFLLRRKSASSNALAA